MAGGTAVAKAKKGFGLAKAIFGGGIGLLAGAIGMYATAVVDQVAKLPKPVANFSVTSDGLTVTCQNYASGQSGWWDFGDGTPLEPFSVDQKEVVHTFAKPGNYPIKLVVRNFLMDENERTVPVDVTSSGSGSAGGPMISGLTVEPVGSATAPATFRVKCEVKDAQQTILDLGSGARPELLTTTGPFEKYVVYEQPGVYPLQLYAMSGTKLDKQWAPVTVKLPAPGALSVVVKVTDSGSRVSRQTVQRLVAVPVPAKPSGPFVREVSAPPGTTLAEAKLGTFANPAVKNLRVDLATDRRTAKVSGEWTGTPDATIRATGGSDLMVPVQVVQERVMPLTSAPQTVAAQLIAASIFDSFDAPAADWNSLRKSATLPLPPVPTGATVKRTLNLTLHEIDGHGRDAVVLTIPDLTKPVDEQVVTLSNRQRQVVRTERLANGQLRVTARPADAVR